MKILKLSPILLLPVIALLLFDLSTSDTPDLSNNCLEAPRLVILSQVVAEKNKSNGSFEVATQPDQTGIRYSINGIDFQNHGRFTGLQRGTYALIAKSVNGCVTTQDIKLDESVLRQVIP